MKFVYLVSLIGYIRPEVSTFQTAPNSHLRVHYILLDGYYFAIQYYNQSVIILLIILKNYLRGNYLA